MVAAGAALVVEFPGAETMLVGSHVDVLSNESHAFHFEAHALLESGFKLELDEAARADHPLPGQRAVTAPQHRRDVPMVQGIACSGGHLSVRRHLAARDRTDRFAERRVSLL